LSGAVVDGFAREWGHKLGGLAHLTRLLIRVGEADDLLFFVWFAKEAMLIGKPWDPSPSVRAALRGIGLS